MKKKNAVIWIVLGMPVATIDLWLSIQAMFGILDPGNFLGYVVVVIAGAFFTTFAVLAEVIGMRDKAFGLLFWFIIFVIDMATSGLCAIWYGQFGYSFSTRIRLSGIHFEASDWVTTSMYLVAVVLAAGGCIQLGRAFDALRE